MKQDPIELYEKNPSKIKKGKPLDLSKKSDKLEPLPQGITNEFMLEAIKTICEENNLEYNITNTKGNNSCLIICSDKLNHDKILILLNQYTGKNFSNFIEKKTGESAKKFFRSAIGYESQNIDDDKGFKAVRLIWRKS